MTSYVIIYEVIYEVIRVAATSKFAACVEGPCMEHGILSECLGYRELPVEIQSLSWFAFFRLAIIQASLRHALLYTEYHGITNTCPTSGRSAVSM